MFCCAARFRTAPLRCLVCLWLGFFLACCAVRRRSLQSLINRRVCRRRMASKLKFLYLSFLCCLCFRSCSRALIWRIVVTLMVGMCRDRLCSVVVQGEKQAVQRCCASLLHENYHKRTTALKQLEVTIGLQTKVVIAKSQATRDAEHQSQREVLS